MKKSWTVIGLISLLGVVTSIAVATKGVLPTTKGKVNIRVNHKLKNISLPPPLPVLEDTKITNAKKVIPVRLPSIGYSKKTGITNKVNYITPRLVSNIRPASINGGLVLAQHGPAYIRIDFIPNEVRFMYNDYYLKANHNYDFQVSEDLVHWYQVVDTYFAPADEVYARGLNYMVSGYYFPKQFARMIETPVP